MNSDLRSEVAPELAAARSLDGSKSSHRIIAVLSLIGFLAMLIPAAWALWEIIAG